MIVASRRLCVLVLLASAMGACGDDRGSGAAAGGVGGGGAGAGGVDAGGAGDAATGMFDDAGRGAASPPDGGGPSSGDAGGDARTDESPPPIDLPEGSREFDGVVNLVDPVLADELAAYLMTRGGEVHPVRRRGLLESTNRFLDLYPEEYDFIIFITADWVDGGVAGRFQAINQRASAGAGNDIELALGDYRSEGRLRGVMAVQYADDYYGPYGHEIAHYWINSLDHSFGFGEALDTHYGVHWGFASVAGHLGGFDESTLRCQTPSGAQPGDCTPEAGGRVRFVASNFAPASGGGSVFSPLELYLMGLGPIDAVPESFMMLDGAALVPDSYDAATNTIVVEADGFHRLPFADIVARHGEVTRLPEAERAYRAAFVVLSAEPASDETLTGVARWAAVFGDREEHAQLSSWGELTGGLSSMDTRLGPRRPQGAPVPDEAPGLTCEALAQDCPREELACYGFATPVCQLAGTGARGEPCVRSSDCRAGLDCLLAADSEAVCQPYCDPGECPSMCPHLLLRDADGNVVGAICSS